MKKIVVRLMLVLKGYEDEDVFDLSAESLGEMVMQSDTVLQDLKITSFRVEEE